MEVLFYPFLQMRILKFKEPSISFPPEKVFVHTCVLGRLAESDPLRHHGLQPARFLCPWNFPDKNMEVGCHFLLQGFSLPRTQTNVSSVSRQILYHWATWEASRCSATPNESKVIGYGMYLRWQVQLLIFIHSLWLECRLESSSVL